MMRACPTCGADPCANRAFCRACRRADRRKALGRQPRYSTSNRPIDWTDSARLAFLRVLLGSNVSLERAWKEMNKPEGQRASAANEETKEETKEENLTTEGANDGKVELVANK
jgi:hypothetical protein